MPDPRMEAAARAAGDALLRAARQYRPRVLYTEEGRVISSHDGVLEIIGLPSARSEEILDVGPGTPALVLGLRAGSLQAAVLGDPESVSEGARVRGTARLATIPVGEPVLGRVLDPLGRPLDGAPLRGATRRMPIEQRAPPIHARSAVHRPLYTGTLAIDAMIPIGRGQRELILGDAGTGRTSLALTAMVRQADTDLFCVYVAIGRRRSETWQVANLLRQAGGRWVIVASPDDAGPGLRYLAPFSGTAVAEYFRDRGEHALVVYDDLTSHAVAWRELSLLMDRPPGREAYPGDVFYLHSRLLERATQLSREHGGGSLTALPIATTEDGRLSAYIPTNLISITDGQVVLSRDLFASGQKPAIDIGLSVSRVGGKTQAQAFRRLAGRLRLEYAAFLELETFARVGARLEESARRRLGIGRRLRRLLRAPQMLALSSYEQLVRLALAASPEALFRIPEEEVGEFAQNLAITLRERLPAVSERLDTEAVLSEADEQVLAQVIDAVVAARWPEEGPSG